MSYAATNDAVLKALGLSHIPHIRQVDIALRPSRAPVVTVQVFIDKDTLECNEERFVLQLESKPAEHPHEPPASGFNLDALCIAAMQYVDLTADLSTGHHQRQMRVHSDAYKRERGFSK